MGYTHYWRFKAIPRGKTDQVNKKYKQACLDITKIVNAYYKEHGGIAGYTAHCPPGKYLGVDFNGKSGEDCENFVLRDFYKNNELFNFCKTGQYPYDILVTAALAVLKYHLKSLIEISSDGEGFDWSQGVDLARQVLRKNIQNPIPVLDRRGLKVV